VTQATTTIATVLFAATLFAQSKPNFTGKWTQSDPDPAAAAGGGRGRGGFGGWGTTPVITQDATTLTVEYTAGAQNPTPQKFVIKLDGSESKNTSTRGGQTTEQISKAAWDGNKLVVTTVAEFQGNKFETKREIWLEGGNLIVQTTLPSFQGGAPTPTKITYKKAS
jgi:hypothetical protein